MGHCRERHALAGALANQGCPLEAMGGLPARRLEQLILRKLGWPPGSHEWGSFMTPDPTTPGEDCPSWSDDTPLCLVGPWGCEDAPLWPGRIRDQRSAPGGGALPRSTVSGPGLTPVGPAQPGPHTLPDALAGPDTQEGESGGSPTPTGPGPDPAEALLCGKGPLSVWCGRWAWKPLAHSAYRLPVRTESRHGP